jgi:L-lactate dehydrogenase complex protein LldG
MTRAGEDLLQHIRRAVTAGNHLGDAVPHPDRGNVGYQGAGSDLVRRFCDELIAAGGAAHLVADSASAATRVLELVQARQARRVLLGQGSFLDTLGLADQLRSLGIAVDHADAPRDTYFAADVGITGVEALIAETGSIVQASRPEQPRSLSLLPPVYIAVAERAQLVPDLFDWFESFPDESHVSGLPACFSLITGPSKTGDIELKLVTGVHGPGEVHVVLMNV